MEITFLGVGESCDPDYPNTSLLVRAGSDGSRRELLLDCGFTVPHLYFARQNDPEQLDGVWISHFHGDHFFGVPLLQLRLREMGRRRPLVIMGQPGVGRKVSQAMELAFPGFAERLGYSIDFRELEPGRSLDLLGFEWQAAEGAHSQPALAVRIKHLGGSLYYSGDGRPTPETIELAAGCQLAVQEAFYLREEAGGHGSVRRCLEFARQARVGRLAMVHLERRTRRRLAEIEELIRQAADLHVFLPETGHELNI